MCSSDLFSFHSKNWWRRLWEKTEIVEITACYDMEGPKELWQPWAKWAKDNLGFNDVEFLNSDTNNDIALIVMSAIKQQTTTAV